MSYVSLGQKKPMLLLLIRKYLGAHLNLFIVFLLFKYFDSRHRKESREAPTETELMFRPFFVISFTKKKKNVSFSARLEHRIGDSKVNK